MPHPSRNSGERHTAKHARRLWFIGVVILLGITAGILGIAGIGRDRRSADERLAEIEAARAIPDAENAALIYDRLLQDPNATALLENPSDWFVEAVYTQRTLYELWLSKDHPELAAWVARHQFIIDGLLEACRLEKCRFPVVIDIAHTSPMTRAVPMRRWGFLLSLAANNDVAEGRLDPALAKWRCLLQMANHLRQQPALLDHILAGGAEQSAMGPMSRFVVTGTPAESCLQKIEAMPLPLQDRWTEYERQARLIDSLILQKIEEQADRSEYIRHPIQSFWDFRAARAIKSVTAYPSRFDDAGASYRCCVATARGIRILVALRRVRNATGRWPVRLEEIRASLPEEILTDPFNLGPFAYRPAADAFVLYSKGKDNIDEGGKWDPDAGPDDWPIWPPRGTVSSGSTDGETQ